MAELQVVAGSKTAGLFHDLSLWFGRAHLHSCRFTGPSFLLHHAQPFLRRRNPLRSFSAAALMRRLLPPAHLPVRFLLDSSTCAAAFCSPGSHSHHCANSRALLIPRFKPYTQMLIVNCGSNGGCPA